MANTTGTPQLMSLASRVVSRGRFARPRWTRVCVSLLGGLLAVVAVLAPPVRVQLPIHFDANVWDVASQVLPADVPLPVHPASPAAATPHRWTQRSLPVFGLSLLAAEHGTRIGGQGTPRLALDRGTDSASATSALGYDATAPPRA